MATMFDNQTLTVFATIKNQQGGVIVPQPSASWSADVGGKGTLVPNSDTSQCVYTPIDTANAFTFNIICTAANGKSGAIGVTVNPDPLSPFTVTLSGSVS